MQYDSGKDWSFEDINDLYDKIRSIAEADFNLSYYPNQIEIISSEQMLDAYSAVGMPVLYPHWSFGKQFVAESEAYKRGHMGLAYEIVINSNPCISYVMEENVVGMQALVMAHACFGHNSFFKNNVHFRQWTDAEAIIDYMAYAKHYVRECEEKYGELEVERTLDHAHALQHQGIDRYKRPSPLSKQRQRDKEQARIQHEEETFNDIWRTIPTTATAIIDKNKLKRFPSEPEENVLYFIEKHAPNLPAWKREIIRIVRKVAQYFYPQMLTQIMNEGWATFVHYTIMNTLYEQGHVTDGLMLEFLQSHTGVIRQQPGAKINPYALGFAIFCDIKRMCLTPTDEDRTWFPDICGRSDWVEVCKHAAFNFKDESFILQYLSPKVIRDFQLFYIQDDDNDPTMRVKAIQNDEGYRIIRERLAEQQNVNNRLPNISVDEVDMWGDRSMTLVHQSMKRHLLDEDTARATLHHVAALWGYPVLIKSVNEHGELIEQYKCNPLLDVDLTDTL